MGKRSNRNKNSNVPAAGADSNTVEAVTDNVTAETTTDSDDEVLAALQAADSPFETVETIGQPADEGTRDDADGGTTVEGDTEIVTESTETIPVTLEPEDEDAVLAELEAEETDKPATKKKGGTKAAPAIVRQFCDVADHFDPAKLKSTLDGITAKKVHEKAANVVASIESGKKLSGFTKLAVKTLIHDGRVSSKTLVEAYQADGKSLGTARAQAQQMTALFKALGIAEPDATNARELVAVDNGLVKELTLLAA